MHGVVKSCINCFLKGHSLRRFQYNVRNLRYLTNRAGTCTTGVSDPPEVVVGRAKDWLSTRNGFGDYNLFENNCEAFAMLCKTEKRVSNQAFSAALVLRAGAHLARDRLLCDVLVHKGQEAHDLLRLKIDALLAAIAPGELIANLQIGQGA